MGTSSACQSRCWIPYLESDDGGVLASSSCPGVQRRRGRGQGRAHAPEACARHGATARCLLDECVLSHSFVPFLLLLAPRLSIRTLVYGVVASRRRWIDRCCGCLCGRGMGNGVGRSTGLLSRYGCLPWRMHGMRNRLNDAMGRQQAARQSRLLSETETRVAHANPNATQIELNNTPLFGFSRPAPPFEAGPGVFFSSFFGLIIQIQHTSLLTCNPSPPLLTLLS